MKRLIETKAVPQRDAAQTPAARFTSRMRTRPRALAGLITLANALGLLVLFFAGSSANAQGSAYPRANPQPALQAANPQAQVPVATYQSALAGLPQGVESQSTDWRSANDTVGQFKRGHIDLLKLENAPPAQPGAQPSPPSPPSPSAPRSQP